MFRTLGALAVLLIATSTLGRADQSQLAAAMARPVAAPTPGIVDLTGSWVGMIVIPEKDKRTPNWIQVVLKYDGVTLTGTAGSNTKQQTAFTNGRIESTRFGTSITFNLPGQNVVMEFQLRLAEGMLKGVARVPNATATAPVELHRVDSNARAKAANVGGIWIGAFALAGAEHLAHVVLEQSGATLTGTAGPHAYKQVPITNGKIATTEAGTSLSFQMDMTADEVVMRFELALTETGLKGTVTVSHKGEQITGPVELIPVK